MLWVLLPVVMVWHKPRFAIYLGGVTALMLVDRFLERTKLTFLVRHGELSSSDTGTLVRFPLSGSVGDTMLGRAGPQVDIAGATVCVCIPKLASTEYHPFSVFYDPYDPRYACFYAGKAGDWTSRLQQYASCHKTLPPMWVAGPLMSEFHACTHYRDALLVCSGTAVTPVLGYAQYYDPAERNVTLVWVVRNLELVAQLLPVINPATNIVIYFTGAQQQLQPIQPILPNFVYTATEELFGADKHNEVSAWSQPTRRLKIIAGRPKDVRAMVEGNIVSTATDPTADNVVCISTSILLFGRSVEGECKKLGLPSVRVDAGMKLGSR
jgi:hypothetical protein